MLNVFERIQLLRKKHRILMTQPKVVLLISTFASLVQTCAPVTDFAVYLPRCISTDI
jgi:hypothetical protein